MGNKNSRIVTPETVVPEPDTVLLLKDAQTNTDDNESSNQRESLESTMSKLEAQLATASRKLRDTSASYEHEIDIRHAKIVSLSDKLKRHKILNSAKVYQLERDLAGTSIQSLFKTEARVVQASALVERDESREDGMERVLAKKTRLIMDLSLRVSLLSKENERLKGLASEAKGSDLGVGSVSIALAAEFS